MCMSFYLLGIVPTYLLGREAGGRWAGLIAALIYAFSPALLYHTVRTSRNIVFVPVLAMTFWLLLRGQKRGIGWAGAAGIGAMIGLCAPRWSVPSSRTCTIIRLKNVKAHDTQIQR